MPIQDLILRFERSCRNVSESIRYWSNIQLRVVEDKLMRQKAQLLLDEAASWSLLWYLYGKEACQFVVNDHTAQLCLRIVQWLEGLASKALELESKVRGSHVGTYLPNSGIWHHTQRFLKKGASSSNTVHHLDFDAPAREHAHQLPDDKYLPFSPGDDSKGSFEEIIERRVLSRSQEIKLGKYDKVTDVAEQHRLQSLQKAMVIQWLCFTPPSNIADVADISAKLLMRALIHSAYWSEKDCYSYCIQIFNTHSDESFKVVRFCFSPGSEGAYALLSFLAEPLKQLSETPDTLKDYVSENLKEFQDWREYYSCDATYRNWLKIELEIADVPELSFEEKQRAVAAAQETLNLSLVLLQRE
ncbi:hypothetical protein Pint_29234 [Pistacia integerrima]|uniref:Uncharacterized protein n=1 Tax=Pistacia integerrima TaxID=434235 RepID=A0ACC0X197_9ROSI|nr:hypothetical protein Pint_29234 [Pistacia integerrima]